MTPKYLPKMTNEVFSFFVVVFSEVVINIDAEIVPS